TSSERRIPRVPMACRRTRVSVASPPPRRLRANSTAAATSTSSAPASSGLGMWEDCTVPIIGGPGTRAGVAPALGAVRDGRPPRLPSAPMWPIFQRKPEAPAPDASALAGLLARWDAYYDLEVP